jgi:hypothetical protein
MHSRIDPSPRLAFGHSFSMSARQAPWPPPSAALLRGADNSTDKRETAERTAIRLRQLLIALLSVRGLHSRANSLDDLNERGAQKVYARVVPGDSSSPGCRHFGSYRSPRIMAAALKLREVAYPSLPTPRLPDPKRIFAKRKEATDKESTLFPTGEYQVLGANHDRLADVERGWRWWSLRSESAVPRSIQRSTRLRRRV